MPLATDIKLPKTQPPYFPDRCVVCNQVSPGATMKVATNAIGWWTALLVPGKAHKVQVPACRQCATAHLMRRVVSWGITIGLVVLMFIYGKPVLEAWQPGAWFRWPLWVAALVCLIPLIVFETFWPRAFDLTAGSENVDYEFRDKGYAAEFAQLNGVADQIEAE